MASDILCEFGWEESDQLSDIVYKFDRIARHAASDSRKAYKRNAEIRELTEELGNLNTYMSGRLSPP